MAFESEYNQNVKRRIYSLLVAKKLGVLKEVEAVELQQLLKEFPAMYDLHDRFMEDKSISARYKLWRGTQRNSAGNRNSISKGFSLFRLPEQSKLWRPVAAVLFPALLLVGGWLWWQYGAVNNVGESDNMYATIDRSESLESVDLSEIVESEHPNVVGSVSEGHFVEHNTYDDGSNLRRQFSSDENEFLVVLEDGTEMHLGYNTVLTYPLRFGGATREVALEGEAYVKVAKESRPFIIHTTNGKIQQFGTTFYVSAKVDKPVTEVVLVEGSVGIQRGGGALEERMTMLNPKDRAIFGDTGSIFVESIDLLPYTSWDNGGISFDKMPLGRLMNVLSIWYGVKVSFADTITSQKVVSGSLSKKSGLDDVLQALSVTSDVEMKLKDGVILVGTHGN